MPSQPRLLIFIVAYHAETTLESVLARIPRSVLEEYACEVLVVDDASSDRTFAVGVEYQRAHADFPLTVLRNDYNQGYGGNQKVGYAYAVARGFDFVALVHGDGQYAPEELPRLLEPLRSAQADAVFGSRMMTSFGALKGGMPLYKYVGNRILSTLQNILLKTRLSEFHSGYRIYSVKTLASLPYQLNSNDFHFDTEIIIQLLRARARIVELQIPTYYGDEICRVNGMAYAAQVVKATLQAVAHGSGILYQRRYDTERSGNTRYDFKHGYASSHTYALEAVPQGASVLDLGSGPGWIAQELQKKGCAVTLVDQHAQAVRAPNCQVIAQDLDDPPQYDAGRHDYILMLDIIEHLRDPERFLERLRAQFSHDHRRLILTTPNIAFVVQRLTLLFGQFNYGRAGILDRTHTRLFTFRSIERLLRENGFRIREVRGVPAPFPKVLGDGLLGRAAIVANLALIRVSKTLFSYQIYIESESTPDVSFLLLDATRSSAELGAKNGHHAAGWANGRQA